MRLDTAARSRIGTRGLTALKEICKVESDRLVELLKTATDINTIRYHQGKVKVLDQIVSITTS